MSNRSLQLGESNMYRNWFAQVQESSAGSTGSSGIGSIFSSSMYNGRSPFDVRNSTRSKSSSFNKSFRITGEQTIGSNATTTKSIMPNQSETTKRVQLDLPDDVYLRIFKCLNFDELLVLKNMKNRRFSDLVDALLSKSTVWVKPDTNELVHEMFYANTFVTVENCFVCESAVNFKLNVQLHSKIRQLILSDPYLLSDLSNLDNLRHLEIVPKATLKKSSGIVLKAINLQVLNVKLYGKMNIFQADQNGSTDFTITLATPSLKCIKADIPLKYFKFLYPNSIEYAKLISNCRAVNELENLRKLEVGKFDLLNTAIFHKLVYLKEFGFYYSTANQKANEFLNTMNRTDLKIIYRKINLNANPIADEEVSWFRSTYFNERNLKVYNKYKEFIDSNLTRYDYLYVENLDDFSIDLIRKLANIRYLHYGTREFDDHKWLNLLNKPCLQTLVIYYYIDQKHLDMIPKHCKFLTWLDIGDYENLNFLLELYYFKKLICYKFFEFGLLKKLIDRLDDLEELRINVGAHSYKIKIVRNDVQCWFNNELKLKESKRTFASTAGSLSNWGDIFCGDVLEHVVDEIIDNDFEF